MKALMRRTLSAIFSKLPAGTSTFVYTTLLKATPLRLLTNRLLLLLLPTMISLPEGQLLINPNDPVISGALALDVYEVFEQKVFRSLINEGDTFLDVGANIGLYSIIAARHSGTSGKIIACEPAPENSALLRANINRNGFKTIRVCDCALADRDGTMQLYLSDNNKGNHSLLADTVISGSNSINVQVCRGDSLLENEGLNNIDIIKIDVEGAEPLVLAGLRHTLAQTRLALLLEFSPGSVRGAGYNPHELLKNLSNNNFKIFEMNSSEQKLIEIIQPEELIRRLGKDGYSNLLCLKGRELPILAT